MNVKPVQLGKNVRMSFGKISMKMNRKAWIKNNKIFVLVTLAVILAAFISIFSEHIGENPFRENLPLENPVRLYTSDNKNYC